MDVFDHLTGAKRKEFSGMIHWLTINNHPSNPHSHPFPTFSTSKKSTCSNFWDATTSNQARRLRDVMTSLQDGLQNCRSFNAGEALFAPGREKRTLSHIDVLQKKAKTIQHT